MAPRNTTIRQTHTDGVEMEPGCGLGSRVEVASAYSDVGGNENNTEEYRR